MNHEQKVPQASRAHTFPAFLDIQGKKIVLIGGGVDAARKARRLLEAGALVSTISEQLSTEFKLLEGIQNVVHVPRSWSLDDFNNAALVVIATDDKQKNTLISEAAHASGCWVNVANQPNASNFLIPSLIDRSPLLVAVSSGGSSPVLARLLTARINAFLPHTYADLGKLAENYRERIRTHFTDWRQRRKFWERLLSGRIGELILQGRLSSADQAMEELLLAHDTEIQEGEVYLVGAGPGDPDLLTFRALRLMQQCDVVLYDRLVSDSIMALVNPDRKSVV